VVASGEACYRRGEIHRLLGELGPAEEAFLEASRRGREPQPGLALLRLAQGKLDAACALIRRALAETADAGRRANLLPAGVEILLAAGDLDGAAVSSRELDSLADEQGALGAMAAQARGAVLLAAGDPAAALRSLRRGGEIWRELDAPYEAARTRELAGLACRALGDEEGAALELEAARVAYRRLGAEADLARIGSPAPGGLTSREQEVLHLVARGSTNKAIAAKLVISERTVDRHVSNIFAKLGVSSRAAATAHAYEHGLL
jgi:DNA-binding NarL/FixJ family response regulator